MSETKIKPISQEEYEKYFGEKTKREALKHALDIRKFEIELYWKRATYFWTFIGATLASYALIQKIDDNNEKLFLSFLVSILGLVFSFAWYCVNRGSKYWQENWENHVDLLENEIIGPLYKTVIDRPPRSDNTLKSLLVAPANFSVSKINQLVSIFVIFVWILLIFRAIVSTICLGGVVLICFGLLLVLSGPLACFAIWKFGKTEDFNHEQLSARKRSSRIEG